MPVASKYTRWPSHSPDAAARKSASVSAVATDAAARAMTFVVLERAAGSRCR